MGKIKKFIHFIKGNIIGIIKKRKNKSFTEVIHVQCNRC